MKSSNRLLNFLLFAFMAFSAIAANAQDARIQFERLDYLETKARDVVEVNLDGKMLELAKRALAKSNAQNTKKISDAISGLKGVYVRVYNFENENEYNVADIDGIRSSLQTPGWEKLVNVRSKKNNQKVDVYTMFSGDLMSGLAVVVSESKSVAVINVIGAIDIESLAELSGKFNIPKIDLEKE